MTIAVQIPVQQSAVPHEFMAEVGSELAQETLVGRGRAVNTILRLAMLAGLQMELEATLNVYADFISEIVTYDRLLVYFWDEERGQVRLKLERGFAETNGELHHHGNMLNVWASRSTKPLIVNSGIDQQADAFLTSAGSASALVLPILVGNRVMGSLQLFSRRKEHFTIEDAQLLWIFALVAENQLSREFGNEGLLRFAFTDYLTGLKTRGYFEQQLDLEIKRAERKKTALSLLMIDIDYFKQLNDQYGHDVGDHILRDVGSILQRDMRELDTAARYGGEEFVIILPETDQNGALLVAQRLRKNVEESKFFAGSPRAIEHLTISVGVAEFGSVARFKRDLIHFADAALYEAKSRGRNQVVLYSELQAVTPGEKS